MFPHSGPLVSGSLLVAVYLTGTPTYKKGIDETANGDGTWSNVSLGSVSTDLGFETAFTHI